MSESARFIFISCGLFGSDSLGGANACAGTAVDAFFGVDHIDIAGRDSLYRTFADAGAACNTQVRIDFVSHCRKKFIITSLRNRIANICKKSVFEYKRHFFFAKVLPRCYLIMSKPVYGTSTFGILIPSGVWKSSNSAATIRGRASEEPLRVCSS